MSLLSRELLQEIRADGEINTLGVIIHREGDEAWIARRPDLRPEASELNRTGGQSKHTRFYWPRARCMSLANLLERVEGDTFPRLQLLKEVLPPLWLLCDEQLSGELGLPLGMTYSVQQLRRWKAERDQAYDLILPLVEGRSLADLLYSRSTDSDAAALARSARKGKDGILTLVNRYIFAGADKCGLLPLSHNKGAPGRPRIPSKPTGKKNRAFKDTGREGFICHEIDRKNCRLGWDRYKKPGVSIPQAYDLFLNDFYAESAVYVTATEVKVTLLPAGQYPTIDQFKYFGQAGDPKRAPALFGLSKKAYQNDFAGNRGAAIAGIKNAMQVGVIDSTSDDQNLCSEASRLLMLQSTHTTRISDLRTGYCFGIYCGFERPSALTHLRAIEHAAMPKVAWAETVGYQLEEGAWLHGVFARIKADNGEGKADQAMTALTEAGIDLEFTPAYYARAKHIIENEHLRNHRLTDWNIPGSSLGKLRSRGEKLVNDSPNNYREYLHDKIRGVLHLNNVERVPHLLDMEMRRLGVEDTRRGILEHLIATERVSSAAFDLLSIRPHTLPRIAAVIKKDGIHLLDPRDRSGTRFIPNLVYHAQWLLDEGVLTRAKQKPIKTSVALDGSFLGMVYVAVQSQWREVPMQTFDPEKRSISLLDWLAISDQDSVRLFLSRHGENESRVSLVASREATAKHAKAERRAEEQQVLSSGKSRRIHKRDATRLEMEAHDARRLGLDGPKAQGTPRGEAGNGVPRRPPAHTVWRPPLTREGSATFMDAIRAQRANKAGK